MRKQRIQLVGMLVALAVLIGGYFALRAYNTMREEKESQEEEAESIAVTEFATDEITAFSYTLDGVTYSYTTDGEDWKWEGDTSLELDNAEIEAMLDAVSGLTAADEIAEYDSLADFGLADDAQTLTFTVDGESISLILGNKNEITSQYYLKRSDSDMVYLVSRSLSGTFSVTPQELIEEEEATEMETETTEQS